HADQKAYVAGQGWFGGRHRVVHDAASLNALRKAIPLSRCARVRFAPPFLRKGEDEHFTPFRRKGVDAACHRQAASGGCQPASARCMITRENRSATPSPWAANTEGST